MNLYTIGFTKKTAEQFFNLLKQGGITRVIDTRLNNVSQLAGFTKKDDLKFFLREILNIDYIHLPILAPTKDILDEYKRHGGDWGIYEGKYLELIRFRKAEKNITKEILDGACLLCSEPTPHNCHRRLAAEYLSSNLGDIQIHHLI